MKKLIIQIILRQWDKSQLSAAHQQARQALPDRYPVSASARPLAGGEVILDQQGDDLTGNRIRFQLTSDQAFLVDRFRIDLKARTVEFKSRLTTDELPVLLTTVNDGWIQCRYQWRYRVEHDEQIFWLYEEIIVNMGFATDLEPNIFMSQPPEHSFDNLMQI